MTLVNVDTHVGPDPKTHVSEMGNFMGRSTPSPAACEGKYVVEFATLRAVFTRQSPLF